MFMNIRLLLPSTGYCSGGAIDKALWGRSGAVSLLASPQRRAEPRMLCVGGAAAADYRHGQTGTHAADVGILEACTHQCNWPGMRVRGAEEHQLPSSGA
jgi:hypothetical protein